MIPVDDLMHPQINLIDCLCYQNHDSVSLNTIYCF
jgi:hypothetical protein